MILLTKPMVRFEEGTNIFVRYNEEFGFVKPRFCIRVFIVKMKGPRDFVQYNEEFVKNLVR